jgi:hypothetical protein
MNDARGTAGRAGAEIFLFHQRDFFAAARTLARDGYAVYAAANDQDVELLPSQKHPFWRT